MQDLKVKVLLVSLLVQIKGSPLAFYCKVMLFKLKFVKMFSFHTDLAEILCLLDAVLLENFLRFRVNLEELFKPLFFYRVELHILCIVWEVERLKFMLIKCNSILARLVQLIELYFASSMLKLIRLHSSIVKGQLMIHHGLIKVKHGAFLID